ncbi:MAG: hypothetical protein ACKO01_07575 [Erythrobacter sp.]
MTRAPSPTIVPVGGTPQAFGWLDRWPVIALICLVAIAPLLVVDLPPLADLYGHLGRYAVQTELAQRPALQPFYSYEWKLIGNLGADILVQAFHPVLGLETSVRVVVILTQLLGALGLLLVSREIHGRVTPFAVAAITLLYGYPFNYGFLNYTLSMALALFAYVVWLRLHRQERGAAAALWLGVTGAAIWVCHTYGWAFLGLLTGSTMLVEVVTARTRPLSAVGRILAACWPLLLPVLPMVIWRADSSGAAMSGWALKFKTIWLTSPLRNVWEKVDIGSAALIVLLLAWALVSRAFRYDRSLALVAVLCVLFFFALPTKVFGSAFADMRLLPYGIAMALVAVGFQRTASRQLTIAAVTSLAFFAGRQVVTAESYIVQARQVAEAVPVLDRIPMGARVAFFVVKPCSVIWRLPVLDHLSGLALARRDAFVNDQWQQPGVNPLTVHYPAAEPFTRDPSHVVQGENCGHRARPPLSQSLARLPRAAFTHVWIVGYGPVDWSVVPKGFTLVPGEGSGRLYRVDPAG